MSPLRNFMIAVLLVSNFSCYYTEEINYTSRYPLPPTFSISNVTGTSFTVNWETVPRVTSYTLEVSEEAIAWSASAKYYSADKSQTSMTITELDPSKKYFVRMASWSNHHDSNFSRFVNVRGIDKSLIYDHSWKRKQYYTEYNDHHRFSSDGVYKANFRDDLQLIMLWSWINNSDTMLLQHNASTDNAKLVHPGRINFIDVDDDTLALYWGTYDTELSYFTNK